MYDFIREILTGNRPLIFDHQLKKCLVIRFYSDFFKEILLELFLKMLLE